MPSAVIPARPEPFPPSVSLPSPAPSASPFPKKKTRFMRRGSLFHSLVDHDLRKVRQPGELPLDRPEQSQTVAPQSFVGRVDEHFDEEAIERGSDGCDHAHRLAVAP